MAGIRYTAEHNRRCAVRALENAQAGRRATFSPEAGAFLVPSGTSGRTYHVRVDGLAGAAKVSCDCEAGRNQPPVGSTACWHGAAGCMAMAEAGLVRFDEGRWLLTDKAPQPTPAPARPFGREERVEQLLDDMGHRARTSTAATPGTYGTPEYDARVSAIVD